MCPRWLQLCKFVEKITINYIKKWTKNHKGRSDSFAKAAQHWSHLRNKMDPVIYKILQFTQSINYDIIQWCPRVSKTWFRYEWTSQSHKMNMRASCPVEKWDSWTLLSVMGLRTNPISLNKALVWLFCFFVFPISYKPSPPFDYLEALNINEMDH